MINRCEEGRRGGRLDEEDKRQRRVEKTIKRSGGTVAGNTSPLTKGKEEERERCLDDLYRPKTYHRCLSRANEFYH